MCERAHFNVGDEVESRLRGKSHWYPATVVSIDAEGLLPEDWRYSLSYSDGFRALHYPPPPPPLVERDVLPSQMRSLREHNILTEIFEQCGGDGIASHGWKRKVAPSLRWL